MTTRSLALLLALATPSVAQAGLILGVHYEHGFPVGNDNQIGEGVGGRLGYRIGIAIISVTPEVEFTQFIGSNTSVPGVGGRLMIGKMVEFGAYTHAVFALGPAFGESTPGLDAGLILELTAIPKIDIGVHGGLLFTDDAAATAPDKNLIAGLQAAFKF